MVAQFLGLRRSKNSSHSLQPNPNTLPPLTPPKKLYGFADLLAKYFARSRTPSHFIPTLRQPLHLLATDRITLEPNTSTYATILFVTSSRMDLLILSIALRTTWSLIRLPSDVPGPAWAQSPGLGWALAGSGLPKPKPDPELRAGPGLGLVGLKPGLISQRSNQWKYYTKICQNAPRDNQLTCSVHCKSRQAALRTQMLANQLSQVGNISNIIISSVMVGAVTPKLESSDVL